MDIRTSRSRVNGLLHVKDGKLVNGIGEEVVLRGVGLGNWLLPEGYMWNFPGAWDRPRRIEEAIRTLCGTDYATRFWRVFRDTYVARRDIEMIAEMGFNSVRIPINARILQREEPGLPFIEEGFALIDRCLDWCEEFNLYAILDLHGAPGGQTGSNIDDSLDDIPRLFIDAESRQAALALWREIARRYRARDIVAAYDLLNEPLRTSRPNKPDTEYLHPELVRFYEDCIADIRAIDSRHAFSIEGANWATRTDTFLTRYDPNAIIHFHRYGTLPGEEAFDEWTALSRRLGIPAWLGESGENTLEWCAAIFPASVKVGAGFNFWSWKRMGRNPAPLEIRVPEGWDRIVDFGKGGPRPTYAEAQAFFDQYLQNIEADRCTRRDDLVAALDRRVPFSVMATDFDFGPDACSGRRPHGNLFRYRAATGMCIKPRNGRVYSHGPGFDCGFDKLCLELAEGEWALYSVDDVADGLVVALSGEPASPATLRVSLEDGSNAQTLAVSGAFSALRTDRIAATGSVRIRVECTQGAVDLHALRFEA